MNGDYPPVAERLVYRRRFLFGSGGDVDDQRAGASQGDPGQQVPPLKPRQIDSFDEFQGGVDGQCDRDQGEPAGGLIQSFLQVPHQRQLVDVDARRRGTPAGPGPPRPEWCRGCPGTSAPPRPRSPAGTARRNR